MFRITFFSHGTRITPGPANRFWNWYRYRVRYLIPVPAPNPFLRSDSFSVSCRADCVQIVRQSCKKQACSRVISLRSQRMMFPLYLFAGFAQGPPAAEHSQGQDLCGKGPGSRPQPPTSRLRPRGHHGVGERNRGSHHLAQVRNFNSNCP